MKVAFSIVIIISLFVSIFTGFYVVFIDDKYPELSSENNRDLNKKPSKKLSGNQNNNADDLIRPRLIRPSSKESFESITSDLMPMPSLVLAEKSEFFKRQKFKVNFRNSYTGRSMCHLSGKIKFRKCLVHLADENFPDEDYMPKQLAKVDTEVPTITKNFVIDDYGNVDLEVNCDDYIVEVYIDGYPVSRKNIFISRATKNLDFELSKSGSLEFIASAETGENINRIAFLLYKAVPFDEDAIFMDDEVEKVPVRFNYTFNSKTKRHVLSDIPSGSYQIIINAIGYRIVDGRINVEPDKKILKSVMLTKNKPIRFNLLGLNQLPDFITLIAIPKSIVVPYNVDHDIIKRDKINQFKWLGDMSNKSRVYLSVKGYRTVLIKPKLDITSYDIHLKMEAVRKVLVLDEKKQPLGNAEISYLQSDYYQKSITDKSGYAFLPHILEEGPLYIYANKSGYKTSSIVFNLALKETLIPIVLKEKKFQKGIVTHKGNPVGNVKIDVEYNLGLLQTVISNAKGYFEAPLSSDGKYYIEACHSNFGRSKSGEYTIADELDILRVVLELPKPVNLKFKFKDGSPFAFKWIEIYQNVIFHQVKKTNEQGVITLKNSVAGDYEVLIKNYRKYLLKVGLLGIDFTGQSMLSIMTLQGSEPRQVLPKDHNRVFTVYQRPTIKLIVIDQKGDYITDGVRVLEHVDIDSIPYSNSEIEKAVSINVVQNKFITFPVYADSHKGFVVTVDGKHIEKLAPIKNNWVGEKTITIDLSIGKVFNFTVKDKFNGKPVRSLNVFLICKKGDFSYELKLQTNDKGQFSRLINADVIHARIKAKGYCYYYKIIENVTNENILFEIKKGGKVEGVAELIKGAEETTVNIYEIGANISNGYQAHFKYTARVNEDGRFSFGNVLPGVYKVLVLEKKNRKYLEKDLENIKNKLGVPIFVENEKTLKLDLSQDGDTTLDLHILGGDQRVTNMTIFSDTIKNRFNNIKVVNGHCHFPRLSPGKYSLSIDVNKDSIYEEVFIKNKTNEIFQVNVNDLSPIKITLRDPEGKPLKNTFVQFFIGDKVLATNICPNGGSFFTKSGDLTQRFLSDRHYYFLIRFNSFVKDDISIYSQVLVKPFLLGRSGKSFDITVPLGRKIGKIKIVDVEGNPIDGARASVSYEKDLFLQGAYNYGYQRYSEGGGYFPENGWPKEDFYLCVTAKKYETRTVLIPKNFDPTLEFQIKLKSESIIICNISNPFPYPVSIGILNTSGKLINQSGFWEGYGDFSNYLSSITKGKHHFRNLSKGNYYIGYFWNNTEKLIFKQGPFEIETNQELMVEADILLSD